MTNRFSLKGESKVLKLQEHHQNLSLQFESCPSWGDPFRAPIRWSVQVALLHRLTVAGSRWCGNWESLSLLYGYSILCCSQRSKCIDSYKISTSQCGGLFTRSCSKHSAARKGEGNQYVPFTRDEKSSTNCEKCETGF